MVGGGVWRWEKREIIYISIHRHHQNDSCIKMGSDESHCNVSLAVRDKVTRQMCSQTTQLLITSSFRCVCVNVSAGVAVPVSMFVCACI